MPGALAAPRRPFIVLIVAAVVALVLVNAVSRADAVDLWDQTVTNSTPQSQFQLYEGAGQSGLIYRGGAGLPLPVPSGGGGTIGAISGRTGTGCGIDFAAELKALFDANAHESYFTGVASSASSPPP